MLSKFMVIGLDGMSMPLLKQLIHRGLFRNIGHLISSGFLCPLHSTVPPVTAPAWATFATGVNPGKHGIFDFALPRDSLSTLVPVTSQDIRTSTFYEYLEALGKQAILINLPLSWPPLTSFPTLTSFLTQSEITVYPATLADQFPILRRYRVAPTVRRPNRGEPARKYIEDVRRLEKVKFQGAMQLMKNLSWDFFFILFGATDWISHLAYDRLIVGDIPPDIAELCLDLDSYVLHFSQSVPADTNIILMSDHGFRVTEVQFAINTWLEQEGYLVKVKMKRWGKGPRKHMLAGDQQVNAINLTALARLIDVPILSPLAVKGYDLLRHVTKRFGLSFRFDLTFDPQRTRAVCVSHELNGIYINRADRYKDGIVSADEYDALREEIISKLNRLTDPQTGERIFKAVRKSEEVYQGEAVSWAPDIVLEPNERYKLTTSFARPGLFHRTIVNDHNDVGILIGVGPTFKRDPKCPTPNIADLAPTILHSMGLAVPNNLDGIVLKDLLAPDSIAYKTAVSYNEPIHNSDKPRPQSALNQQEDASVLARLRGLGYLD